MKEEKLTLDSLPPVIDVKSFNSNLGKFSIAEPASIDDFLKAVFSTPGILPPIFRRVEDTSTGQEWIYYVPLNEYTLIRFELEVIS